MKTKQLIEGRLTVVKALMNDHKFDIEELKKERKQLKKQLEELPKLEVGKWYWADCSMDMRYLMLLYKPERLHSKCYIVNGSFYTGGAFDNITEPATDKEVQTALIKEAKKRGFKEGVRFNHANIKSKQPLNGGVVHDEIKMNDIGLFTGNFYIFCRGKWATIIEKKVSISGDFTKEDLEKIIETEFK